MELIYRSYDGTVEYKFVYIAKTKFYRTHLGKTWAPCTQCIVYYNGLLVICGTVIKHHKDKFNQKFAYTAATKKAMAMVPGKLTRKAIWDMLFEKLNNQT